MRVSLKSIERERIYKFVNKIYRSVETSTVEGFIIIEARMVKYISTMGWYMGIVYTNDTCSDVFQIYTRLEY